MKRRCTPRQRGFTLLEILVSTALLSSVFVAVVALSSQSLRNLGRLQPHATALTHAREKMNQLLTLEELTPGSSSGSWNDGYRWAVSISPQAYTPKSTPDTYALFDIRVEVSWGIAPLEKTYVLETTQWAKRAAPNGSR